jgi:hypothetical protein
VLLKVSQPSGKWKDVVDADGGLTSSLGFRLVIDESDMLGLFVVDAATGMRRVRAHESEECVRAAEERANVEAEAHRLAEERLEALRAENERLRRRMGKEDTGNHG